MDGFQSALSSLIHSVANTGASRMMNTGFTDWNTSKVGVQPKMDTSGILTKSCARKFSDEPACSNSAQNRMLATNRISMAM